MGDAEGLEANSLVFDEVKKAVIITLYMDIPQAICTALGSLEVAKDQVKMIGAQLAAIRKMRSPGLIVPGENGNGGPHVL